MDKQKYEVSKHSSTASRLSQRIALSQAQTVIDEYDKEFGELEIESWDISAAFLQGLTFKELRERSQQLGIEVRETRRVFLRPPRDVWRILAQLGGDDYAVSFEDIYYALLELLKPMYGLVDAPLLWQLALLLFISTVLGGTQSIMDDNYLYWVDTDRVSLIYLLFVIHVDDILAIGRRHYLDWAKAELETRFGALKCNQMPFQHNGMRYRRLTSGAIIVDQEAHFQQIKAVPDDASIPDDFALASAEQTPFRGLLCQMLYDCQTRIDALCECVQLQSFNNSATRLQLRSANALLKRSQKISKDEEFFGLIFQKLRAPLRAVGVGDASHATKHTVYAQEAKLVLIMSDVAPRLQPDGEVHLEDVRSLGGAAHPVVGVSSKSGRVSYSTSHAETAGLVGTSGLVQMVSLRLSEPELFARLGRKPRCVELLQLQELAEFSIPCDLVTDCNDAYNLIIGAKGVPADKTQRIGILSLREDRLKRRLRRVCHFPTDIMLADGLTKPGIFPQLNRFLTSGVWRVELPYDLKKGRLKPIHIRSPVAEALAHNDSTEQALLDTDETMAIPDRTERDATVDELHYLRTL